MDIKSKNKLKGTAQKVFKQYKKTKTVFATLDGNVFLDKNRAALHAGKGSVLSFDRAECLPGPVKVKEQKPKEKDSKQTGGKETGNKDSEAKAKEIEVKEAEEVKPPAEQTKPETIAKGKTPKSKK